MKTNDVSDKAEEKAVANSPSYTITIEREKLWKGMALFAIGLIVLSQFLSVSLAIQPKFKIGKKGFSDAPTAQQIVTADFDKSELEQIVLPAEGIQLPITWGDLGKQMIKDGVIDEQKFRKIFPEGFSDNDEAVFTGNLNQPIVMTNANSRFILDMLWAFGLANKNDILENGEMTDPQYGGDAGAFAATGGWSLSAGMPMDHYSAHSYVKLTAEEQNRVDSVSRGIFRPCCGNSTHFPDCNHGMAMLGLLQLMAADGASEQEMYDVALVVNSFWFPQTYMDLAVYFEEQGVKWNDVSAQEVLSSKYSSGQGYQQTRGLIKSLPQPAQGGGGCGA